MNSEKDDTSDEHQGNKFDKILHENMEAMLPGLIKKLLNINVVDAVELPDNVQFTKERKPDVLKKITDDKGNTFVLHLELQTYNEIDMVWRMAEYLIMLARHYKLEVKQYVIYIGVGKSSMPDELKLGNSTFRYQLISLSLIDYRLFLRSDRLEEKMLALLGDFGKDNPHNVLSYIITEVHQKAKGDLEIEQRKNQLRILIQLRKLVFTNIKIMESVSTFFKEENDFLFIRGEKKGIEEGKKEGVIKVALNAKRMGMTVSDISKLTGLTEDQIKKLKEINKSK